MSQASAAPSLSHIAWRATEFILAFGPLRSEIVLDYFVLSPFFDRSSNNAQLRMQMMFSRGGMEGVDEEVELRRFVGIEYALVHSSPPGMFIIHKRDRVSATQATTIAAYYILNDSIYQGPTLYTVMNERLLTSLNSLSKSLTLLRDRKPKWTPERHYEWDVKPPPPSVASALPTAAAIAAGALDHDVETENVVPGVVEAAGEPVTDEAERKSKKRARVEGEGEEVELDDEVERPPNQFNPLLFRALKSVAKNLGEEKEKEKDKEKEKPGTTVGGRSGSARAGSARAGSARAGSAAVP